MKISPVVFTLPLLISQPVFALTVAETVACPQVDALVVVGVNLAAQEDNVWVAYRSTDSFGTPNKWTLTVGPLRAKNAEDAIKQANESLSSLSLYYGPERGGSGGWSCTYYNHDFSLTAFTITPPWIDDVRKLLNKFNLKSTS